MKFLLAGIIFSASPLNAQVGVNCAVIDCPSNFMPQPVPPSAAARLKVLSALADIKIAEIGENDAADDLEKRAKQIKTELAENIPWYKPWAIITDDAIKAAELSDPEYLRRMVKHQSAVATNYKAHNEAVLEASKAFQLFPPVTDFTGDPRASGGANMVAKPWLPHYSRHEKRDAITGQWRKRNSGELAKEQSDNAVVGGGVKAAYTRGNGVMEFYDQAFASPENLAILIYHETSHWVDIAGKSGGFTLKDPPSVSFRTEQHAYERAAQFAVQLGGDPTPHLKMAAQFRIQAYECETKNLTWPQVILIPRWIGKDRSGSLALVPAESEISPGDVALLQKKFTEAGAKAAAQARKQVEIDKKEHDERLRNALAELAQRYCTDPGSMSQAELDALPKSYNSDFYLGKIPPGLSTDCVNLYLFLGMGERNAETLRSMSARPAAAQPIKPSAPLPSGLIPPSGAIEVHPRPGEVGLPEIAHLYGIARRACVPNPAVTDQDMASVDWTEFQKAKNVERVVDKMSPCERRVFMRLLELGRAWTPGTVIGADAVREAAAEPGSGARFGGGSVPPTPDHDPVWGKISPIIRR